MKQQTENKTNKNSVANDKTNYAVNRKVSEVFNEISTNTQPVIGAWCTMRVKTRNIASRINNIASRIIRF